MPELLRIRSMAFFASATASSFALPGFPELVGGTRGRSARVGWDAGQGRRSTRGDSIGDVLKHRLGELQVEAEVLRGCGAPPTTWIFSGGIPSAGGRPSPVQPRRWPRPAVWRRWFSRGCTYYAGQSASKHCE